MFLEEVSQLQLPKIFLVVPTNNEVDVLENILINGIPTYIQLDGKWDTFVQIYHLIMLQRPYRVGGEETLTSLGKKRYRRIPDDETSCLYAPIQLMTLR